MSAFLLYHKKTRPTGRTIARALGIRHGVNPDDIPSDTTKVIRWGNAKTIRRSGIEYINPARGIMLAGDKLATLQKLEEEGVPHVEFSLTQPTPTDRHEFWFGRKRRGFGGHDIVAIDSAGRKFIPQAGLQYDHPEAQQRFQTCEFFTKYVDNKREYRIHVANGEIIRYQRKYARHPELATVRVQNHKNGYVFKQPHNRLHSDRTDACIAAVEALGLDFGAVDMIVEVTGENPRGTTRILEVNTAPSCSPKTAEAYINALREVI